MINDWSCYVFELGELLELAKVRGKVCDKLLSYVPWTSRSTSSKWGGEEAEADCVETCRNELKVQAEEFETQIEDLEGEEKRLLNLTDKLFEESELIEPTVKR